MLKPYSRTLSVFVKTSITLALKSSNHPTSAFRHLFARANSTMTTRNSTCLCGSVEIQVTGTDKGSVLCHCANCQAQSGSAFMHNHRFTKSEMKFVKGGELVKRYADKNTKSGNELTRGFCSNCGSALFLMNPAFKGLTILTSGTIAGDRTQPSMELFPENKYQWLGDVTGKSSKL